jgi:hypothetical protein
MHESATALGGIALDIGKGLLLRIRHITSKPSALIQGKGGYAIPHERELVRRLCLYLQT